MNKRKSILTDVAWWLCVFCFGFIIALAVLSTAWNYDVKHTKDEAVAEETAEEEVVLTMESSRVSGSTEPKRRAPEQIVRATVSPDTPVLKLLGGFRVTAYCACQSCCGKSPDDPWYGITATGTKATQGRTIAVDPRVIPYGTVLYFEGPDGLIGGYVAEDCGGSIKGNRIDLYFDSHEEADEWGIRELDIYII